MKIISERNLPAGNDFLRKSGLNHILKDKSISFSWASPYSYVAEGNRKIKFLVNKYRREIKEPHFSGQADCSLVELAGVSQSDAPAELLLGVRRNWSSVLDNVLTPS